MTEKSNPCKRNNMRNINSVHQPSMYVCNRFSEQKCAQKCLELSKQVLQRFNRKLSLDSVGDSLPSSEEFYCAGTTLHTEEDSKADSIKLFNFRTPVTTRSSSTDHTICIYAHKSDLSRFNYSDRTGNNVSSTSESFVSECLSDEGYGGSICTTSSQSGLPSDLLQSKCHHTSQVDSGCPSDDICAPDRLDSSFKNMMITEEDSQEREAIMQQREAIMQQRYQDSAFLYFQDADGDNELTVAIIHRNERTASEIIKRATAYQQINLANKLGQTALILAVIMNLPDIVKELLVYGAQLNAIDMHGNSALHIACMLGHHECAEHLLTPINPINRRAVPYHVYHQLIPQTVEIPNYEGLPCLHLAALHYLTHGNFSALQIIQQIVKVGGSPNVAERKSGKTILHLAAESGNKELIYFIMNLPRIKLNTLTYSGHTPAQLASGRGLSLIVQQLQSYGADMGGVPDTDSDMSDISDDHDMFDGMIISARG